MFFGDKGVEKSVAIFAVNLEAPEFVRLLWMLLGLEESMFDSATFS